MTCYTWATKPSSSVSNPVMNCLNHFWFLVLPSCLAMNLSEQISHLFSCNISPSETPHLDIGVSKRVPLEIAVPMTIFYSCVFICGVWTDDFREMARADLIFQSLRFLILQVIFNGVCILTLLIDAHMRISAIRFYLLSLIISGTCHHIWPLKMYCQINEKFFI